MQQENTYPEKRPVKKPLGKLVLAHLGGWLMALIFCIGLTPWMINNMVYVCIPVVLFLYSIPIYRNLWALGHEDYNLARFGHIKLDRTRGLKLAILLYAPYLLLGVLLILSKFNLFPWSFVALYKILNAQLWPIINAIQISWYMTQYTVWQALIVGLLPLLSVGIAAGAYLLGTYDFALYQRLVYKNEKNKSEKK